MNLKGHKFRATSKHQDVRGNRLPSLPQALDSINGLSIGVEVNPAISTRDASRVMVPTLEFMYQLRC